MQPRVAWGQVIDASATPPQIRWAGATDDQPVDLGLKDWTPVNGDKVLLFDFASSVVAVPFEAL